MKASESANRLKELINKAIDEHTITRSNYDAIINIATEDGHIDSQERALLSNLQDMIDDRTIKIVAD